MMKEGKGAEEKSKCERKKIRKRENRVIGVQRCEERERKKKGKNT